MFWKRWEPCAPKGFRQEPNAGGSSETSEVSQLEMFPWSPPSCDVLLFFFGGVGGGEASFLVVKKTGKRRYFVCLGVSKCCFF